MTVTGEKPKYLEKDLSHCHFVHYKTRMEWPGFEKGLPIGEGGELQPEL
jgi:hypothetical protein